MSIGDRWGPGARKYTPDRDQNAKLFTTKTGRSIGVRPEVRVPSAAASRLLPWVRVPEIRDPKISI